MPEAHKKPEPVTFRDRFYIARKLTVAGKTVSVKHGLAVVTDKEVIKALDNDHAFKREG